MGKRLPRFVRRRARSQRLTEQRRHRRKVDRADGAAVMNAHLEPLEQRVLLSAAILFPQIPAVTGIEAIPTVLAASELLT